MAAVFLLNMKPSCVICSSSHKEQKPTKQKLVNFFKTKSLAGQVLLYNQGGLKNIRNKSPP